jgi:hypothetical protein
MISKSPVHVSGQSQCAILDMMAAIEFRILDSEYVNPIGSMDLRAVFTSSVGSGGTNLQEKKKSISILDMIKLLKWKQMPCSTSQPNLSNECPHIVSK